MHLMQISSKALQYFKAIFFFGWEKWKEEICHLSQFIHFDGRINK